VSPLTKLAVVLCCFGLSGRAVAQAPRETWRAVPPNSSDLANKSAELLSSSGLSWPDGRQSIVTFWRYNNSLYRCVDDFNASLQQTGALCYVPVKE